MAKGAARGYTERMSGTEPTPAGSAGAGLLPEQWVQMIEICPEAVLVIDAGHRIQGWNRAAEALFGFTKQEAIGQDFELLVPDERRAARELARLTAWNEDGGEVREVLTERRCADGRPVLVRLSRQVLRDREGQVQGAIAILRDVTESEGAMRRAAEALHLARLGRIASQIAHEMRNPLAGIHGAIQILQRRSSEQSEEAEVYAAIGEEVRRLDRLVTDLQRFARPSGSRVEHLELGAWLRERVPVLLQSWPGIQCTLATAAEVSLSTDPVQLEEVLTELIKNAVDAVGDASLAITIELQASATGCRLRFADNGPGIPAADAEQVFEPFHTTKARGSGLGLALARRHAESLGGSLELITHEPDSAAFVLSLPLA